MLYPPGIIVVLSRQLALPVECCACPDCLRVRSAFPPRLTIRGDRCVVKSVGGSLQVPRIRRAILQSRQEIDLRGDCEWTTASAHSGRVRPTNLVSERLCGRRLSVEDAGLVGSVGIERS